MMPMLRKAAAGCAVAMLAASAPPADALVINTRFEGLFAGDDASAALYRSVALAAANTWENLTVGWEKVTGWEVEVVLDSWNLTEAPPTTSTFIALTYGNTESPDPNPATGTRLWTSARVDLNSVIWGSLWWDPTPLDNGEFVMTQYDGLYGIAGLASPAQDKYDAYSTILHEFGHVLGFMGDSGSVNLVGGTTLSWSAYTDFANNLANPDFFTFDYLPGQVGKTIPMAGAYHIDGTADGGKYQYDTMAYWESGTKAGTGPAISERRLVSPLDLRMIADAFHVIPEPSSILLTLLGSLLLLATGTRGRLRS